MNVEQIEIQENSLGDARKKGRAAGSKGLKLISEFVVSSSREDTFLQMEVDSKTAFLIGESKIPIGSNIISEKELRPPELIKLQLYAEDMVSAKKQAEKETDETSIIQNISLSRKGKKGFLGISRTLNQYDINILKKAKVEITYTTKPAIIIVTFADVSEEICFLCDQLIKTSEPYIIDDIIKNLSATNDPIIAYPILDTINTYGRGFLNGHDINITSMLCKASKALKTINDQVRFIFHPRCFLCHTKIHEIEILANVTPFGEIKCPKCDEIYEYTLKEFEDSMYLNIQRTKITQGDSHAITNFYAPVRAELILS